MKKGAKVGIIIGVIVAIIAIVGVVGFLFVNDKMQQAKVVQEFAEMSKITKSENFSKEALTERTSKIVSTGKYASVEKAAKKYADDLFGKAFEMQEILKSEQMGAILTAENYKTDGPEFTETKKYITETKQQLEDGKKELLNYLEEEKINSYIEEQTSDSACIELYKKLLAQDIKMSDTEKSQLDKSIEKIINALNIEEEVIDYLIKNKDNWEIKNDQILFNSNSLVVQYNAFLTRLRIAVQ